MRRYILVFLFTIVSLFTFHDVHAQDVYIRVPASNIFNRTEYLVNENTMFIDHGSWRAGSLSGLDPTLLSVSGSVFNHASLPNKTLPASVLKWRLFSIGGRPPDSWKSIPDVWPDYKYFTPSGQAFYQPGTSTVGVHPGGIIALTYKIQANEYARAAFIVGDYQMNITHNYQPEFGRAVNITPASWRTIISVPAAITWFGKSNIFFQTITSLDDFRTGKGISFDLGNREIAHTVDFKLWVKAATSAIQFTSSENVDGVRELSLVQLSSTSNKITTAPLSSEWKDFTSGNENFIVENGNRNTVPLSLKISAADLKNHFFQAGTYKLQLNLDAKGLENPVADRQDIEITLKVPALSEISISSVKPVDFQFNTAEQYKNGESQVIFNHIRLSNNENYELFVKTETPFFSSRGILTEVPSTFLQVGLEEQSSSLSLTATPQKLIEKGTPVLDRELNIRYTIPASAAQALISKEKTTYVINLIYSFVAL